MFLFWNIFIKTLFSFLSHGVKNDRLAFLDEFTRTFFSAGDRTDLVSESFRLYNKNIAAGASPKGTLDCIGAFSKTDFRGDLAKINIPTLVIHGDSDATVPFEYSGKRTHEAIPNAKLALIKGGGPHGLNTTHPKEFNEALLSFLND